MKPLLTLMLCLLTGLGAEAAAQTAFVVREGATGAALWRTDGGTAELVAAPIAFDPVALAGRALRHRLRLDLPARVDDGVTTRVRLPQGGSLFLLRHGDLARVMHITAAGEARLHLGIDTTTPGATLLSRVAVSDDGTRALVATSAAAGGDVFVLDLEAGAPARSLTPAQPPLAVSDLSLRVSKGHAWFADAQGALRHADLTSDANAIEIPLQLPAGTTLLPELAADRDATCVAFVTENSSGRRHIRLADGTGAVTLVTPLPGSYDLPRYDSPLGPMLAVSPGGLHVAYRARLPTRELLVQRTDSPAPVMQVTGDLNFDDTIDNVGVIEFVGISLLVFIAGEVDPLLPDGPIGSADVYRMDALTGESSLLNLTQTSGFATTPFDEPGELEVLEVVDDPQGARMLIVVDPSDGDYAVVSASPVSAGLEVVAGPLGLPPSIRAMGDAALVVAPDGPLSGTDVLLIHPEGHPAGTQLVGTAPDGLVLDRFAEHLGSGAGAMVVSAGPGLEFPLLLDITTGTPALAWNLPFEAVSAQIAFAADGSLVAGLGFAGGPFLFAAFGPPLVGSVIPLPVGHGYPLPY